MNCHYCNKFIADDTTGISNTYCVDCRVLHVCLDNKIMGLRLFTARWVDMNYFEYSVDLKPEVSKCSVYKDHKLIVNLDYLPDVQPDNIEDWISKLLNLKAFL